MFLTLIGWQAHHLGQLGRREDISLSLRHSMVPRSRLPLIVQSRPKAEVVIGAFLVLHLF